nr:fibronectin type III domain-containing protein [uncultured Devosia sp.]
MTNIFGLCARLARVVVLVVVALSGMSTAALAMSQACSEINDFWGAGRTIAPAGDELEQEIINHGALASGETLIWAFSTTGTASGSNFVIFQITMNGANDLLFYSSADQGNVTNAIGTHTVTQADNPARGLDVMWSVDNPSGETGNSLTAKIYCTSPVVAPTLSGISPTSGPVAGGTRVTLTGTGLSETYLVTFGGRSARSLQVHSATSVSMTTPPMSEGMQIVELSGGSGRALLPGGFNAIDAPPVVESVSVPNNGTHAVGAVLRFEVRFDQDVAVSGTPQIALTIGGVTRHASYRTESDTRDLVFYYFVQEGDQDHDGIEVGPDLEVVGGSIRNMADTHDAKLTLNAVPSTAGVRIDGIAPTVLSVEPIGGALPTDSSVTFNVRFSEPVVASGGWLSVRGTGTVKHGAISWTGGADAYTVHIDGLSGKGTIELYIVSGVPDAAGNRLVDHFMSGTSHSVAVPQAPAPPTISSVSAGDAEATVSFNPPVDNGGEPITSYTVTSSPDNISATGASSPITVGGLTNGQAYTFTAVANNAIGASLASAASGPVTPKAPLVITPTGRLPDAIAGQPYNISFSVSGNSGAPTWDFVTSPPPTLRLDAATGELSGTITVEGEWSLFVRVTDEAGSSAIAGVDITVLPQLTAPNAPHINQLAAAGNRQIAVEFTPSSHDGGSQITHYTVTSYPEGKTGTGSFSPIMVAGLTNGVAYSFTMTATNAIGTSLESNRVGPIVLIGRPSAPTITSATPGDGEVTVDFTTPADDGGSAISSYYVFVVSPDGSFQTLSRAQSPITVTGLTNGRSYTFEVAAFNGIFVGDYSARSAAVTPSGVPIAPSITGLKAGDQKVEVQFLPPVDNGGAAVTEYTVLASPGYHLQTGASSPITVGGLTNGTPYTIIVTAHNAAGVGAVAEAGPIVPIGSELAVTPQGSLPEAMAGEAYSVQFAAAGGAGSVTYGTIDSLPLGLTLSASGQLSGTPAGASSGYARSLDIYASDSQGRSGSATVDLRVVPRAVTVQDKTIIVPSGSPTVLFDLAAGATGGPFNYAEYFWATPNEAGTVGFRYDCMAMPGQVSACMYYTPAPGFVGEAKLGFELKSQLGKSNRGTITFIVEAEVDLDAISETFSQLSQDFVTTRSGLLSGAISEPGIRDRRSMGSGAAPGSVSATAGGNSATLNFAGSTLELQAFQAMDRAMAVDTSGLNFWIDGTATLHVRNQDGDDSWGSFALASVGADVMVDQNLMVGVALHSDWMEDLTDISAVEGRGVLVGPYLSAELTEGLFLDASVYYGQSWNRADSGAFGGDFETQRLLVKARLEGDVGLSEVLALRPSATLFYLREEMGGYAVTDGSGAVALVEGFATEQLRLSGGLRLDYSLDWADGLTLSPYGDLRLGLMMTDGQEGVFGTLGLGAEVLGLGDWRFSLGSELGLDSQGLRSVSGKVGAGIRF